MKAAKHDKECSLPTTGHEVKEMHSCSLLLVFLLIEKRSFRLTLNYAIHHTSLPGVFQVKGTKDFI